MIDFDGWRASYDTMSYAEHLAFYDRVWAAYPSQQHFDLEAILAFFDELPPDLDVLEIGGWRGEVAAQVLSRHPRIRSWTNLEICRGAVEHPICLSGRYHPQVPDTFVWDLPSARYARYDVLVASHVIEHMRASEFERLLERMPTIAYVYLASPLHDGSRSWAGYNGSHILEIGWTQVTMLMDAQGFVHRTNHDRPEVRVFWR